MIHEAEFKTQERSQRKVLIAHKSYEGNKRRRTRSEKVSTFRGDNDQHRTYHGELIQAPKRDGDKNLTLKEVYKRQHEPQNGGTMTTISNREGQKTFKRASQMHCATYEVNNKKPLTQKRRPMTETSERGNHKSATT